MLDRDLLNAKLKDLESLVSDARYFEKLQKRGETPESISTKARDVLGLAENETFEAHAEQRAKNINLMTHALVALSGAKSKLVELEAISGEELSLLNGLELKLATRLSGKFGVEVSELFEEEE